MGELFANNFAVQLAAGCVAGDLTISVTAAAPAGLQGGQFRVLVDQEYMIVTAGQNTTTWTVTRGDDGSTPASHGRGSWVTHVLTAGVLSVLASEGVGATVTPNGLDQTAELNAALSGVNPGATVLIRAASSPLVVTGLLTAPQPVTLRGEGVSPNYGSAAGGVYQDIANLPMVAPALKGAVISQHATSTDILHITAVGGAVNLRDIGFTFNTLFATTGHAVVGIPGTYLTGKDQGLMGAYWSNVIVYGHDGDHYAFNLLNMELCTFDHLQAFGGGGLLLDSNASGGGFYGNCVFDHPYFVTCVGGSADMVKIQVAQPTTLNRFFSPQCWLYKTAGNPCGVVVTPPTNAQLMWHDNSSWNVVDSPDFESNVAGKYFFTNDAAVTGQAYFGDTVTPGGGAAGYPIEGGGSAVHADTSSQGQFRRRWQYLGGGLGQNNTTPSATAAYGAGAGTSPPSGPVIDGTALRGTITWGTGSAVAAADQVEVTFGEAEPFANVRIVIAPTTFNTVAVGPYVSAQSKTGFTISFLNAPNAFQGNTIYGCNWVGIS